MAITAIQGGLYPYQPYCGAPPNPASLLTRWNLDPILITALIAIGVVYALLAETRGARAVPRWRRACFYAGWALGAAALISPLCPLSVSLFAARVGQHMVLAFVAAPLLALGRPAVFAALWTGARGSGREVAAGAGPFWRGPLPAAAAFAAALWFWHSPGPYTATFESDGVYWLMHLTTFGAALWLWTALFAATRERLASFLAAALFTTLQMGFLGAVITFAAAPLYPAHRLTTGAWGLTQMQDQQLGGVVMWIPAGAVILLAMVFAVATAMRPAPRDALAAAQA